MCGEREEAVDGTGHMVGSFWGGWQCSIFFGFRCQLRFVGGEVPL